MGFRLALAQMLVVGGEPERNLAHAEKLIAQAAREGAAIVLLPETMDLGWTDPCARRLAQSVASGSTCMRLRTAARRHGVLVCAGITERDGPRVFNSAVLINGDGEVLGVHRKLNELDIGHACYDQGDRLGVYAADLGVIGLMICSDALTEGESVSRALCYMGADVILSPSAWAVPSDSDASHEPYGALWRDAYAPVAKAFSVWIAGVSNVGVIAGGPWAGRHCIGSSIVISADGDEVLTGPYGVSAEALLYVDVAPVARPARGADWASYRKPQ